MRRRAASFNPEMLGIGDHSEHSDYVSNVSSAPVNDYDYMFEHDPYSE